MNPSTGDNSEPTPTVQGFYLTRPPLINPDYQNPTTRGISEEPDTSGPYEEIDDGRVHSTQPGVSSATYENSTAAPESDEYQPMPDLQPAEQKARYANVADARKTYENAGYIPDTSSGIYEYTPGGYEDLKRVQGQANRRENKDSTNSGNPIIYDSGYEPSGNAAPDNNSHGIYEDKPAEYEELKRAEYENIKKST